MKTSVRAAARDAKAQEKRAQHALLQGTAGRSLDSFVNFAEKLGVGADNALTTARYALNPLTRNRMQLEWVHRGSWLGGVAIDIPADDMTREGVEFNDSMEPGDQQRVQAAMTRQNVWGELADTIRWGRLYGGAIAVMLVDGQDPRQPLRPETVGPGQFKGLLTLDRWMLEPSTEDLVTEYGPDLGKPKYYRVGVNAPALRNSAVHHTRIAMRHVGVPLPYQQSLTENLWGMSIIERLWDRMISYDSASTGAAQLVGKAFLRTLKVKSLRDVVAAGGKPLEGLLKWTDLMRRFQNNEGITLIDGEDEFDVQEHGAFSGLADVCNMMAMQVSGALQIPLVRMLGQSPGGLGSNGDSELRTYYDGIGQQQERHMHTGINLIYRLQAQSEGIKPPDDFCVEFASLYKLDASQKAEAASKVTTAVTTALEKGAISQQVAVKELRQLSKTTGVFSNITQADIDTADGELSPPGAEEAMGLEHDADQADADRGHDMEKHTLSLKHEAEQGDLGRQHALELQEGGQDHEADQADRARRHESEQADLARRHQSEQSDMERRHGAKMADKTIAAKKQEAKSAARPNGQAGPVAGGQRKRNRV